MALQAVKILPKAPELMPGVGGRLKEVWRITSTDGTGTTILIQPHTRGRVEAARGNGNWSHDIPDSGVPSSTGFTVTFAAAPAAGPRYDVDIDIRVSA